MLPGKTCRAFREKRCRGLQKVPGEVEEGLARVAGGAAGVEKTGKGFRNSVPFTIFTAIGDASVFLILKRAYCLRGFPEGRCAQRRKAMKKVMLVLALLAGGSVSAQDFIVGWPDQAGDDRAEEVRHTGELWVIYVPGRDACRFRPRGMNLAFTFHAFSVKDTTDFMKTFPTRKDSFTAFVVEELARWNLEEEEEAFARIFGRRWRTQWRFEKVMRGLLGETFGRGEAWKDGESAFVYRGKPLAILWDDPQKSESVMDYDVNGVGFQKSFFDCSLHGARWIVLGREPLGENYVLLLLTKELHGAE